MKARTTRDPAKLQTGGVFSPDLATHAGLLCLLFLASSPPARADSDGYYCDGPGYIAVEFRAFNTPGLGAPHVLKLAVFGGERGPRWAGEVEMTDFQTHWMRCDDAGVIITGWGDGKYVRYLAGENKEGEFAVLDRDESAEKPFGPRRAVMKNLGQWGIPGVYELQSIDPKYRYELRVTATERPADGVIQRDHKSVLVQLDRQGNEQNRLVLYEGASEETID